MLIYTFHFACTVVVAVSTDLTPSFKEAVFRYLANKAIEPTTIIIATKIVIAFDFMFFIITFFNKKNRASKASAVQTFSEDLVPSWSHSRRVVTNSACWYAVCVYGALRLITFKE